MHCDLRPKRTIQRFTMVVLLFRWTHSYIHNSLPNIRRRIWLRNSLSLLPFESCRSPIRSISATLFDGGTVPVPVPAIPVVTPRDCMYMREALECAKKGSGYTFPNPAVGCVLVRSKVLGKDNSTDRIETVIGRGFHPRAGFPHAEVFALWQAAGHVECGLTAAQSIIQKTALFEAVDQLAQQYSSEGGVSQLLASCCAATTDRDSDIGSGSTGTTAVTAYVTLEPCCHTGKRTPPCATSLLVAGVARVVIGIRDPNPRVDGGGVQLLRDAGVQVDVLSTWNDAAERSLERTATPHQHDQELLLSSDCAAVIANFWKRIAPRSDDGDDPVLFMDLDEMTGKMRRALRAESARRHRLGTIPDATWGGATVDSYNKDTIEAAVEALDMAPEWMEHVDGLLWQHELVVLRLGKAVSKRKGVECLGRRIAQTLQAHVAQTKGHTVLLYRPGRPPTLQLERVEGDEIDVANAKEDDDDNR